VLLLMLLNFMVARMLEKSSSAEQRGDDNATESGLPHFGLLKVTGCPAGSRWAWNAGGPSSAHSSRGAAAGKGNATLDLGPYEVRTEQPGC